MILQRLCQYYERLQSESDTAPEGFQRQEIPFFIVLTKEGKFNGIIDNREVVGKKKQARLVTVPRAVKRARNAEANLLWDNCYYIFGAVKENPQKDQRVLEERALDLRRLFLEKLRKYFPDPSIDKGIEAVIKFLSNADFSEVFSHEAWQEIKETGANLTFKLDEDVSLVCNREAVYNRIFSEIHQTETDLQQCLITGEDDEIVRLHGAIKGVWDAQPTGGNIVSFNLDAFESYGKSQGQNAPVGKKAEFAYTTALNTLLSKSSRQRIQIGDASTVFWAKEHHHLEDFFGNVLIDPAKDSVQDVESMRALFRSPQTGVPPFQNDRTPFYVLGLSPNSARISIRFWHEGTVSDIAEKLQEYFLDIQIERNPKQPEFLSLNRLLSSIALEEKYENIPPNLAGDIMFSILEGIPFPETLLAAAIRRMRAKREVTYARASVIKAALVRRSRYYTSNEKEVSVALDKSNQNSGYLLGRLFAVLERAQEFANPGINATIRDRFYGSASSTPVAVFSHLLKLKNYHIAKLENRGMAVNLEKLISEIMNAISDFPAHLSLPDQGRFAIGYYHQRHDFFSKHENKNVHSEQNI